MTSITIRRLGDATKARLRVRAAQHGRSMEEEAREIWRTALAKSSPEPGNLVEAMRAYFEPFGGLELPKIRRGPMPSETFITSLTEAEILTGIELLPNGKRRANLKVAWTAMLLCVHTRRVLPFDGDAALSYSRIVGKKPARQSPHSMRKLRPSRIPGERPLPHETGAISNIAASPS